MKQKTDIVTLYEELCKQLKKIEEIEWIDLWNNQVTKTEEEYSFSTPALFLSFQSNKMEDLGNKIQNVEVMIDLFLFCQSKKQTNENSLNQRDSMQYLKLQSEIQKMLHGRSGEHFSNMCRVGFSPIDIGKKGNLNVIKFQCKMIDKAAQIEFENDTFAELEIQPFIIPKN